MEGSSRSQMGGSSQQLSAICSNLFGQGEAISLRFGQTAFLDAMAVAFDPLGFMRGRSQSGAATDRLLSAKRMASPTHIKRLIARTLAHTWVESVRCRPRAFSHPCCLQTSRSMSKSRCSAFPSTNRLRNAQSTLASKPGSARSNPNRYFQSMRPRAASAACRSGDSSMNCRTVIKARRHGASSARPLRGKSSANA